MLRLDISQGVGVMGRQIASVAVSATIFAALVCGCGPRDVAQTGAQGAAPVTLEVKAAKWPTTEEVARSIQAEGAKEWLAKRGTPDIYFTESGYTVAGWVGFTGEPSGAKHDLTFVGFDPASGLAIQDGKPFVFGKSTPKPLPTDARTERDDVKRAVLGRKAAEVKRVLGPPESTREFSGTILWYYPKRTKDEASGKDDKMLTVTFSGGYVSSLSFD